MKPKILVSRKISDLAEEKLQKEFDATLNLKDEPIPENELIKIVNSSAFCSADNNIISDNYKITKNEKIAIIPPIGGG